MQTRQHGCTAKFLSTTLSDSQAISAHSIRLNCVKLQSLSNISCFVWIKALRAWQTPWMKMMQMRTRTTWVHERGYEGVSQAAGWTPSRDEGVLGVHGGPGNFRGIAWEVTRRSELYFIMVQN